MSKYKKEKQKKTIIKIVSAIIIFLLISFVILKLFDILKFVPENAECSP